MKNYVQYIKEGRRGIHGGTHKEVDPYGEENWEENIINIGDTFYIMQYNPMNFTLNCKKGVVYGARYHNNNIKFVIFDDNQYGVYTKDVFTDYFDDEDFDLINFDLDEPYSHSILIKEDLITDDQFENLCKRLYKKIGEEISRELRASIDDINRKIEAIENGDKLIIDL